MGLQQPWLVLDNPQPRPPKRITLSVESISTIPFRARTRYFKILECGHLCSNRGMPCLGRIFGTFWGAGVQRNENSGVWIRCLRDIFLSISYRDIQWPAMLIAQTICQVSLVRCTNDWHNRRCGRKPISHIPQPVAFVDLAVYSVTFRVCVVHWFKFEVGLKWKMCQNELYTFENIPVV